MVNQRIQFSTSLLLASPSQIEPALAIYRELQEDLDQDEGVSIGFAVTPAPQEEPGALRLTARGDGNLDHVTAFVQLCSEAFGLTGRWGFRWALTSPGMQLDGSGGGAHVLDLATGETVDRLDCEQWLASQLATSSAPSGTAGAIAHVSAGRRGSGGAGGCG